MLWLRISVGTIDDGELHELSLFQLVFAFGLKYKYSDLSTAKDPSRTDSTFGSAMSLGFLLNHLIKVQKVTNTGSIINPVQINASGMDPVHLKNTYGNHITFWGGGVDTQKILSFGFF